MKAEDSFTLSWCEKHRNWWVTNCPDCMVDSNEPDIRKAGIKEVVDWMIEPCPHTTSKSYFKPKCICSECKQAKLKEWGIK